MSKEKAKDVMKLWVQAGGRQLGKLEKVKDIASGGEFEWLGAGRYAYGKKDELDLYAVYRNNDRSVRAQYYMKFNRVSDKKFTVMPRRPHVDKQWNFQH